MKPNSGQFKKGQIPHNKEVNFIHQNLSGKRYGRWLVVKENGKQRYGKNVIEYMWLCRCDCGKERNVRGSSLRGGNSNSCGCLQKELQSKTKLPNNLSFKNRLFRQYKRGAITRGFSFELPFELFISFLEKDCHYCGSKPTNQSKSDYSSSDFKYNGIDRIDNTKGYKIDNVVACCKYCNALKSTLSEKDFRNLIIKIYKHFI